ncbi:hypothetical protein ACN47A_13795, partial [Myxococcus fulvus]
LLAGWARTMGLSVTDDEVAHEQESWWRERRVPVPKRDAFLSVSGLDSEGLRALCEELALERLVLAHSTRLLPDGPSWDEALAAEARLRGRWAEAALEVAASDEEPVD